MSNIHQIYQKAIRENLPYVRKGQMTIWESDSLARKNTVKYISVGLSLLRIIR